MIRLRKTGTMMLLAIPAALGAQTSPDGLKSRRNILT